MKPARRRLISAALLLAVFGGGLWLALRAATGAAFVSGALAQLLDAEVEVGSVSLQLGAAIEVELRDVRVTRHGDVQPTFEVESARTRRSWPQILAGRFAPKRWELRRPLVRIESRPAEPGVDAPDPGLGRIPPLDVSVEDGTVIWIRPGQEELRVERLRVEAEQPLLRNRVDGTAAGVARLGSRDIGSFSIDFQGWLDGATLEGSVKGVDVGALPRGSLPRPQGRANGEFTAVYEPGRVSAELDLEVDGFRLRLPELKGPIAPREMRVKGEVVWADGRIELRPKPLALDDFVVTGDLRVDTRGGGRIRGFLALEAFELGVRPWRLQLLRLGGLRFKSWADLDSRSEAGFMEDVRLDLDMPLAELGDRLAFKRISSPEQIRVRGRVRGATYRPNPDSIPLEGIDADVRIEGNVVHVENLQIFRGGDPLPRIDVTIDGMHRLVYLPPDERKVPRGPGEPIPGLGPAFSSFGPRVPGRPEAVAHLERVYLGHPAFVFALRDAEVDLSFPPGKLRVDRASGVFGGAPAEITGIWDHEAETVRAHVAYASEGDAPPRGLPPTGWAEGEFRIPTLDLGDWRLEDAHGLARVTGSEVSLTSVTAHMHEGSVVARVTASLAEEDHAPYHVDLHARGCNATRTGPVIGLRADTLSGTGEARGTLTGKLSPDRLFVEDAEVHLQIDVRDGELGNTPFMVTLARLATPLGWTSIFGRALHYDELTTQVDIAEGILRISDLSIEGPQIRMLMAGEMDLLSDALNTELLVALLFLESVDTIVEKVPVFGRWMLGDDQSLITAYFRLEGPYDDLDGSYVPPQTIRSATGWAGKMIGGGVRRVRDMLTGSPSAGSQPNGPPPKPAADPPTAVPAPPVPDPPIVEPGNGSVDPGPTATSTQASQQEPHEDPSPRQDP